ncbi:MAG TPA: cytochrome c maturation protein CcmE [Acidobacteriota bacterium]|nr:cytochrome c maturation protein CcmE [Acidobacteriota bacterium]
MPNAKFIIAGVVILGAISYLMFSGINNSMVYYYTVPELLDQGASLEGRGLRLSGHVLPGSIERNDQLDQVKFLTVDHATEKTVAVVYEGIIPDTFKDRAEVVVEGRFDSSAKVFHANTLLAKCPSKYESEEGMEGYEGEGYQKEQQSASPAAS